MGWKYKTRGEKGFRNSMIGIQRSSGGAREQAKKDILSDPDCPTPYFNMESLIRQYIAIPPIIIFTDKL